MRRVSAGPLAALLAALLVIGAVAALLSHSAPDDSDPSSRSTGNAGTLALYQWLSRLGLPVQRLSGDFDPSTADVLVVAEPSTAFTAQQAQQVVDMVRGGGEVVLATDRAAISNAGELLQALGAAPSQAALSGASPLPDAFDATPALPVDAAALVRRVPMRAGIEFDVPPAAAVPLLVHDDQVVGVTVPLGSGRAYVLGSPYPLSNLGLREGDSATFVLSLVERARGGRIAFDEFHHGESASGGAQAALTGPVGLAGLLAAAAVFLYLLLSGRRLGRPIPATDPARVPSATEYVDAMGRLIERTAQRGGVAERYAEELKRRVGAATAIDPRLDDDAFLALLDANDPAGAEPVRAALARCRELARARPSGAQLVALARQVDEVESRFAVGATAGLAEFRG